MNSKASKSKFYQDHHSKQIAQNLQEIVYINCLQNRQQIIYKKVDKTLNYQDHKMFTYIQCAKCYIFVSIHDDSKNTKINTKNDWFICPELQYIVIRKCEDQFSKVKKKPIIYCSNCFMQIGQLIDNETFVNKKAVKIVKVNYEKQKIQIKRKLTIQEQKQKIRRVYLNILRLLQVLQLPIDIQNCIKIRDKKDYKPSQVEHYYATKYQSIDRDIGIFTGFIKNIKYMIKKQLKLPKCNPNQDNKIVRKFGSRVNEQSIAQELNKIKNEKISLQQLNDNL